MVGLRARQPPSAGAQSSACRAPSSGTHAKHRGPSSPPGSRNPLSRPFRVPRAAHRLPHGIHDAAAPLSPLRGAGDMELPHLSLAWGLRHLEQKYRSRVPCAARRPSMPSWLRGARCACSQWHLATSKAKLILRVTERSR